MAIMAGNEREKEVLLRKEKRPLPLRFWSLKAVKTKMKFSYFMRKRRERKSEVLVKKEKRPLPLRFWSTKAVKTRMKFSDFIRKRLDPTMNPQKPALQSAVFDGGGISHLELSSVLCDSVNRKKNLMSCVIRAFTVAS